MIVNHEGEGAVYGNMRVHEADELLGIVVALVATDHQSLAVGKLAETTQRSLTIGIKIEAPSGNLLSSDRDTNSAAFE